MSPLETTETSSVWPIRAIRALGRMVIEPAHQFFFMLGEMSLLLGATIAGIYRGLTQSSERIGVEPLIYQMVRVGVKAIPIVILIQLAIGMILPLQMFPGFDEFGQGEQIATVNAIAALRELGPLMTAVVLSGFAGASIAAELGAMVTAEEVEALKSMALSPVRFLVIPRLVATTIMTILLTVIADVVMVFGGWLTGIQLGIDSDTYYNLSVEAVEISGFISGLVKAGVYGFLIGLIACYQGLSVKIWEGSAGVGRATTNTVVYSLVAVITSAAIFTVIFYRLGFLD